MSSDNDIHDVAAEWVARMDAEGWADSDEAQLQQWLARDERHRGALLIAHALWMSLDPVVANENIVRRRWDRRAMMAGGAAALAASLAVGFIWTGLGTTYETRVGEIRRLPLEDGTFMAINTASKLNVNFTPRRRSVRIAEGEAWFQIAKDASRPFLVEAGRVRVQAVGTAFSVRRRDGGAEILITEGTVEAWASQGQRLRLTVGQRAFIGDSSAVELMPAKADADRELAWRFGRIELANQSIANAVEEMNRYNERKIILADSALGAERIDGVFRVDDPVSFAIAVQSSFDVPIDLSDPKIIRIGHILT